MQKIFIIIFDILAKFQWIIINRLRYPIFILKHEEDAKIFFYEKHDGKKSWNPAICTKTTHFYFFFLNAIFCNIFFLNKNKKSGRAHLNGPTQPCWAKGPAMINLGWTGLSSPDRTRGPSTLAAGPGTETRPNDPTGLTSLARARKKTMNSKIVDHDERLTC